MATYVFVAWNSHMYILPPSYDVRGCCTIRSTAEGMSS